LSSDSVYFEYDFEASQYGYRMLLKIELIRSTTEHGGGQFDGASSLSSYIYSLEW